jgi:hypothetical protein
LPAANEALRRHCRDGTLIVAAVIADRRLATKRSSTAMSSASNQQHRHRRASRRPSARLAGKGLPQTHRAALAVTLSPQVVANDPLNAMRSASVTVATRSLSAPMLLGSLPVP